LCFLVDTGCRRAEFVNLNIIDVNLVTGSVQINFGKGSNCRTVNIGFKTQQLLRFYLRTRSDDLIDNSPLFANLDGSRISIHSLQGIVNRRADQAGVKRTGLHDFRRCFAITMLRNGVDLLTVSRLLGHTTLEVTKRYLYQITDDLAAAHRKASPVDCWRRQ